MRTDYMDHLAARFLDFYNPPTGDLTLQDLNFVLPYAIKAKTVLDVCAGSGRLGIPLAQHGLEVTCLEPAKAMVTSLFVKVSMLPQIHKYISIIHGAPQTMDLKREYGLILMAWAFFYVIGDEQRLQVLKNFHRHLKSDGVLVLDTKLGERVDKFIDLGKFKLGMFEYACNLSYTVTPGKRDYEAVMQVKTLLDGKVIAVEDNPFTADAVPTYAYFEDLMKQAGFRIDEAYANSARTPLDKGDGEFLLVVARKA